MHTSPWSYEQLLQLAPDTRTLEQARRLFFAKGWEVLAGNGEQLWGEYHTKYGQRVQAAVNFSPAQLRCSCKLPRRPCKHSLALVLLFLNRPDAWIVNDTPPDWVVQLLRKATPAATKTTAKDETATKADQAKRLALMDEGAGELEKWFRQAAHQGLANLRDAPAGWERLAARMVDCKLGSIARRLRRTARQLQQPDWIEQVVRELGSIYLFLRAWQRKSTLSPSQKRELMQVAGWNIRKDQVFQSGTALTDHWLVLGLEMGAEEKLTYRRTWLRGEKTGRFALLLDFTYGQQTFEDQWVVGSVLQGEVVYYPGQPPLRALFRSYNPSNAPYDAPTALSDFEALGKMYSEALASSPWLEHLPADLDSVTPVFTDQAAYLLDANQRQLSMPTNTAFWQLLAVSGGASVRVFGEYNGASFKPLSVLSNGRIMPLVGE